MEQLQKLLTRGVTVGGVVREYGVYRLAVVLYELRYTRKGEKICQDKLKRR